MNPTSPRDSLCLAFAGFARVLRTALPAATQVFGGCFPLQFLQGRLHLLLVPVGADDMRTFAGGEDRELPPGVDDVMQRIVGATLVVLGVFVFTSLIRHGREFRMRSRWMLLFALPVAVFEFSLGVWLVVKGFQPSPITAGMAATSDVTPAS